VAPLAFSPAGAGAGWARVAHGARRLADGVLRPYANIVLARSWSAGVLLVAATSLDLPTGLGGLAGLAGAALLARAITLPDGVLTEGPHGYNALFAGLAVGHLFGAGPGALALAAAWGALTVLLAASFVATAGRLLALPALTVPFLLATYLLLLVAPSLGLSLRPPAIPLADPGRSTALDGLRSIGALVFVARPEAGVLVAAALLLHSRVAFLLAIVGAVALLPLLRQAGPAAAPMLFNGVLAAMALGGTWFVPGPASFALAAAGAALCGVATLALQRVLGFWGLPLLVLPFNVVLFVVLCAMRQRARDRSPKAVDFAPGSPERNLRFFQRRIERAVSGAEAGVAIGLPFRGRWICTQGIDGAHTHQGTWRHAFDFEVAGQDGQLRLAGADPHDLASYHCYRLPVLAAADGTVVKVENDVPDNPIGFVDLDRNWGNVVMLYHAPGVYSLVAHLAWQSVTVREGQVVRRGEVVGLCGSSGRSPQPHLHFQLQGSPLLGAPTRPCAFEGGVLFSEPVPRLVTGVVPREGEIWKTPDPDPELTERLVFAAGTSAVYRVNGRDERLTSELDLFGQTLIRSSRGGVLFFARTPAQLTVLDVEAPPDSVLHALRAALGRVPLTADPGVCWLDHLPPAAGASRAVAFLRDVAAPFLSANGAAMKYRCVRGGGHLAINGHSLRARRDGRPAVVCQVVLHPGGWPAVVHLEMGPAAPVHAELHPLPAVGAPLVGPAHRARRAPDEPTLARVIRLPSAAHPRSSQRPEA
jgi:murein DD-endopeptidase MepM/ murein hydrolase activator NlpD/urea transporter